MRTGILYMYCFERDRQGKHKLAQVLNKPMIVMGGGRGGGGAYSKFMTSCWLIGYAIRGFVMH